MKNHYVSENTLPAVKLITAESESGWRYCILCNRWWHRANKASQVHFSGMKPMLPYTGEKCPECVRIQEKRKQEDMMPKPKLTPEQKQDVMELIRMGWSNAQIGNKYGLHQTAITHYRKKYEAAKAKAEVPKKESVIERTEDDSQLKAWEADIEESWKEPEADEAPEADENPEMENYRLKESIANMQREILVEKANLARAKNSITDLKQELHDAMEKIGRLQLALNEANQEISRMQREKDSDITKEHIASYIDSKLNDLESQVSALYRVKTLIGA
jgi:chromosome segregation ATPase